MSNVEKYSLVLGLIVSLILISSLFFDYQFNTCGEQKLENVISASVDANKASTAFVTIWARQFIDKAPIKATYDELNPILDGIGKAINQFNQIVTDSHCNVWGYLKELAIVIAFGLQFFGCIFILIKLRGERKK